MTLDTSSFSVDEYPFKSTKFNTILSLFPSTVRLQIFKDAIVVDILVSGLNYYYCTYHRWVNPNKPVVIFRLHKKGCAFRNRAFEKSKPRYPLSFLDNSRFQFRKIHHSVNFKRTRAHPKWIYKYDRVVICRKN